MFKRSKVSTGVLLALSALTAGSVMAQDTQRVEITGSSIKRIASEGALPIQVLRREDIARSGATSTTDLLQRLPAIQGGFSESSAVGSGGGFTGVSIHNIGETRTLVLLNGHRLAQYGGQTLTGFAAAIDLNSIPVSAIDRVEILTDGASALYGSDAIAGVVNFITRRDTTEGDVSVGVTQPRGGAREVRASVSKGFGSLDKDGYNVYVTASHDERTKLDSTSRNFGSTGKVFFNHEGKSYRKQQFSPSPIPANALDDQDQLVSPYLLANGSCPEKTFRVIEPYNDGSGLVDDYCGFDFVGELEIYPVRTRDSLTANVNVKLGDHTVFFDVLAARSKQTSRIAPVPGGISIPAGTALHDKYLLPVGITVDSTAFYRLFDLGKRESRDSSEFLDLALGSKGVFGGWDYNATLTHSRSDVKTETSGYPGALAVGRLRASGALDPFVLAGQQSAAGLAAIAAANYKGYWDGGTSTLTTAQLRGAKELGNLSGGAIVLGTGVNYGQEKFVSKPSLFAQAKLADPVAGTLCDPTSADPLINRCDQRFGDESAALPYSADRKSYGAFAELSLPVTKQLEVTTALRYDNYSDFGNATTAKASVRFQPTKELLVRASIGSGFHAPSVPQVKADLRPYGVTNDKYTCSPDLQAMATSLGAVCQPGSRQYDQLAGGNPGLLPEKSRQATLGIRFEPNASMTLGADLWYVGISDSFGQLTEQEVFAKPQNFTTSWGTKTDTGTGITYLAFKADNRNLGNSHATGLDIDAEARTKLGFGDVSSRLAMTYMIREVAQTQKGGKYYSAIGNFAELGTATFRWKGKWTNTLKTGSMAHTLALNFQSSYLDQATAADRLDAQGNVVAVDTIRLKVKEFFTLDWQSVWAINKSFQVTAGAVNLLDKKPPLAVSTGGVNRGQQFGYDDRYFDSRGRQFYLNGSYKF